MIEGDDTRLEIVAEWEKRMKKRWFGSIGNVVYAD